MIKLENLANNLYRKGQPLKYRRQHQPERAGRRNVRLTRSSGCGKTTTLKMINRLIAQQR